MNSVERVKTICKERKIPISKLEKDLGFSNGYIGQLRKGVFPDERLYKIAEYLGVTVNYLITGNRSRGVSVTCPDCGTTYLSDDIEEITTHNQIHEAWEKAKIKFGKIYSVTSENEDIKARCRNICDDINYPLDKRYDAALEVLRCLFSRSLVACRFNLNHATFSEYVAMMMNTRYSQRFDTDLKNRIINQYGTMPGIDDGDSYYHVQHRPQTIAAHLDTSDLTDAELKDVQNYIDYIKSKRNKGN